MMIQGKGDIDNMYDMYGYVYIVQTGGAGLPKRPQVVFSPETNSTQLHPICC